MRRPVVPAALLLGIVAVSTASLFIRYAQQDAPSLVIAAGRLGLATLVLAPFALARHASALRAFTRRDLLLGLGAGAFLALHFATWIVSLEHTSVMRSVVMVTTTPLWVALLSPLLLRERLARGTLAGVALALVGGLVIATAGGPAGARGGTVHGDLLALSGAWMMTGYLMVGRRLRARTALVPYVFLVYGMAAVLLWVAALGAGQSPAGVPAHTWLWISLLALVPQLLGHSTFNWALRFMPAAVVSVAMLGEPVGSAGLAWAFLGESPGAAELLGAALILAGIVVSTRGGATSAPPPDSSRARPPGA